MTELRNPLIDGPFTRTLIELRWGDMDAYGHVNNVTQLKLLEEARVKAFGSPTAARDVSPGLLPGGERTDAFGLVMPPVFREASADVQILVSGHAIEYRDPIPYRDGPIAIDVCIVRITPVIIKVGYVILEPDGSKVYSVAESDLVFVDAETGRARRLRDDEQAAFADCATGPLPLKRR
ncbi:MULTISPECIES: acyl-CoA thioesterase [unclassified Brevibacterium]|uniref:acyl-CoA thioesterase n=1 Tax=unclassified Brevibacterium TaxID=2614124 RepID=UPI0008A4D73E|nr:MULTISPECIES: acyl-CoA thioesterase [unclassified Brevibacterium]OFL65178.1 thioesterase [Brevibacterium sp. HMSC063G07]OFS25105.1 thioesterase [Brevibacterium sp. HMSC07C04]